jgi:hypothetical protein
MAGKSGMNGGEKMHAGFGGKTSRKEATLKTWEDNIRMDIKDIRWEGVNWIHMTEGRER